MAASTGWNVPLLIVTLCASAIIGDSVGYAIGYRTGPRLFNREQSRFFRKDHLIAAQRFYEKHGGKTIVLARFMPIIRTFAPVVAGIGKMNYARFLFFNVFGGIGWVASMIMRTDAQQGVGLNIVVGIVGALIAGFLISPLVGLPTINDGTFSIGSMLVSLLGAVILLAIVNLFRRGRVR